MVKLFAIIVALMIINDLSMHLEVAYFGWPWFSEHDPWRASTFVGPYYSEVWSVYWTIGLLLMLPVIWRVK